MFTRIWNQWSGRWQGVALLSLAWLAVLAWPRPLMLPDEGRYVGVAWEMMRSGQWLVPTLDGMPYFHKPPLFYWITASAMSLLGPSPGAARAAPLLGAWAGAMALYLFLLRWWGARAARMAIGVLLVQPLFYAGAQFANLDMLVAGCMTVTTLLLAHAVLMAQEQRPFQGILMGAYASAALGVMAKGLIGGVLPALTITAWLLTSGRWRVLPRLVSVPGLLIFLALTAPWFVAMQARFPGFLDYFFVVQHFKRFAAGGFNNVQPLWFYPLVLVVASLPWLPWLQPHVARGRLDHSPRGTIRRLAWTWLAVVVVFFSIPASKLLGYVLPALPPLALLMADGLETWLARAPRTGCRWIWSAGASVTVSLVALAALVHRTPHSTEDVAKAWRTQGSPQQPLYMLDAYYFDLPVAAGLTAPVPIVHDWADPTLKTQDSWRKELYDAGTFAPQQGQALLIKPDDFAAQLCQHSTSWLVGDPELKTTQPVLAAAQTVFQGRNATLWRLERDQAQSRGVLRCPQQTQLATTR